MNCDKKDLLLYAVTDRHWLGEETLYEQVEKALKGGSTFIQLREKELDTAHFLEEAKEIQKLCREYKVPFVINDNVEIAAEIEADGVHVGQSDMEAGDVRAKLGADKIIGVSAQTVEQALRAQEHGADYLGVGAVFPTGSKADAVEVDHNVLKAICEAVDIPVIAIGVPTVVEAAAIIYDAQGSCERMPPHLNGMFVTPKNIDEIIKQLSFTLSEALNIVFQVSGKA